MQVVIRSTSCSPRLLLRRLWRCFVPKRALLYAVAIGVLPWASSLIADPLPGEAGWTGLSNVKDVIAARQKLMGEMELLMQPIDSFTVGESVDLNLLRSNARTIASLLTVLPHLFPPTTNLYDASVDEPGTIALPAIWQSFPAFYAFADAAAQNATNMATKKMTAHEINQAATNLRASCDACHMPYLRAYEPETVNDSDKDFDFDSVFK
jgi:cytochrome c556